MRMKVLAAEEELPVERGSAVAIGVYDGLHCGHQWLLRRLRKLAGPTVPLTVVTFDPHPLQLLRPVSAPRMLTDIDQRLELLENMGIVDACLVLNFDADRQEQRAIEFIDDVVVGQLHARDVMVGSDFHFGRGREGDVTLLGRVGAVRGFNVQPVPLLPISSQAVNVPCSSTYIRGLVARGQVEHASRLLARAHGVRGIVVGTSRPMGGRGTPTVVVRASRYAALPAEGSYAGTLITPDGRRRMAGVSVRQGLMAHEQALLDVHIVGDAASLIDQRVGVELIRPIWASGRADLVAEMSAQAEEIARASAVGGWAGAT